MVRAVLFLAIIPITIIMLNEDFLENSYAETLLDYTVLIVYSLVVGRHQTFIRLMGLSQLCYSLKVTHTLAERTKNKRKFAPQIQDLERLL